MNDGIIHILVLLIQRSSLKKVASERRPEIVITYSSCYQLLTRVVTHGEKR